ncbi:glycosyltransferase [Anaerolineales bacterium HSG25]|nr:glycosyltransferase [Anaerolineales bacterium HSG25]
MTELTISIVINTCDRADPLRTLLHALNQQTYPNFEVLVVVGPTRDDSVAVVGEFGERVVLVRCPKYNLSMSRNMGIAAATGDIIAFIDDDAVPCSTWLAQMVDIFQDPKIAGTGGRVYNVHPGSGQLQFRYGIFSLFAEDADVRPSPSTPLPTDTPADQWFPRLMGANMAYRRLALASVGGFDERFPYLFEEPDIAIRLAQVGYRLHHSDEMPVYHAPASSRNREMFTMNINWYLWMRGIIYFTLKHAEPVVGKRRALNQAINHALDFFKRIRTHHADGSLSDELYEQAKRQLWQGIQWGFRTGLFRPRLLAPNLVKPKRLLQPFLTKNSSHVPHILPLPPLAQQPIKPMNQPPLRICLLSTNYPPSNTEGVARLTHLMAQGLSELGHEIHVITEGQANYTTVYDGAYVHQIKTGHTRYNHFAKNGYPNLYWSLNRSQAMYEKLVSLRQNHNIQLADSTVWLLDGLVTSTAGDIPLAVRLVTSARQIAKISQPTQPIDAESQLIGELEAKLLHQSQGLIPISGAIQESYADLYQVDFATRPHQLIHAGIKPLPNEEVYPLDGQSKDEPIVLYVGRLERRKGLPDLLAAIPHVLQQFPKAQFWLAGSDNSTNDGFAEQYQASYPDYFRRTYPQHVDQVRFLGYVPDNKLDLLYQVCDLFVAPSLFESFGLIFLEAMNHARPTIGCNVGGPTEIVLHGETGLLVPPQSPGALAGAIIRLLGEPKTRRVMGLAGRERLLNQFTYLKMAEQYAQFYRSLIKGVQ